MVLLQRLAVTVSIAIQQSELYEQCQQELAIRQQAEAELAQSQKTLRAIFDSTFEFMGLLSRDGIVLDANQTALDIIAADLSDVVGLPFWDTPWWSRSPEEQHQQLQRAIARAATGETIRFETTHVLADGAEIYVDFSIKPILDDAGNIIRLVPEGRDISDRKRATQQIEQQAALLDIASDAIFVRDLENRILYWNQGAERLYGWQSSEVMGQCVDALLQNPDTTIVAAMQRLAKTGSWQGESRNITRMGKPLTVQTRWTLVRNKSGQPQSILTVDTDITEKKQLEAQFYQAQRLESVGQLASGIAHDLNNVFTPILTMAQLLRMGLSTPEPAVLERITLIEDSAKRGANMVQQILTFTRGTSGDPVPTNIPALLHEVVAILRQSFPIAIEIRHDVSHPLLQGQVLADPTQLHQVLMNLCVNARDAMPDGGVLAIAAENTVLDETAAPRLHPDAEADNYVVITIADTGTGIPDNVRDRIFEPFFTTKEFGKGTGLGLSTVLGIVKSCGGFLHVQTEMGQGTQFKIYLPVLAPSSDHPTMKTKKQKKVVAEEGYETHTNCNVETQILIVDDDILVQQTTQALLKSHHYATLVADDGITALQLYRDYQETIQLIVLDIMMPTMDGFELIQQLKAINPNVKILAMSGISTNRPLAIAAGANTFLTKPYSLEEFVQKVTHLLA